MEGTGPQRQAASLRRSALAAQSAVMIGVALLAWTAVTELGLPDRHVFAAAAIFAGVMLVADARLRPYHPFSEYGPANRVTTVRMGLVAFVTSFVIESPAAERAIWIAAAASAAAALDGLDGWLARRGGMASAFGARFDMEVDALLIQALAVLTWQYGKAGPWVILSGLMRYAFVVAGCIWPWMARPLPPSQRAKAVCVLQIGALIVAVVPAVPPAWSEPILAAALLALTWSFLIDTLWLHRQPRFKAA
jgi:phosphatidylglycerophosphate synthase